MPDKYSGENRRANECSSCSDAVARSAVKQVFAILGVDVDDPQQVSNYQKNVACAGSIRRASEHSFLVAVGAITVAIVVAIGLGIMAYIKKGIGA